MKKFLPVILSFAILSVVLFAAGKEQDTKNHETVLQDSEEKSISEEEKELRGVWVSYAALDIESADDKKSAFGEKIDAVIRDMKSADLNTMIVQVRPFADALYRSEYYPWSHILTSAQGEDPGFDPLKMICEKAHEEQLDVHAWINPYRVSTALTPSELCENNPYVIDPSIGIELDSGIYLDPSDEKAQQLIVSGVKEIVENYEIDGIQFDDYFYPTQDEDFDKEAYEAYQSAESSPLSLSDWRKENVNTLISDVYDEIHRISDHVVFGISPQGNMGNNDSLYADVKKWCREEGYVDYICPQIYFSLDNPACTFEDALSDWLTTEKHENLKLCTGLALYKAGTDADEGTWLDNDDIIKTEIEISRENHLDGFMLFCSDSFHKEESEAECRNMISYLTGSTQAGSPRQ